MKSLNRLRTKNKVMKGKTIWGIKFIKKFRSLQKCKETKSREKKQKRKESRYVWIRTLL